MFAKEEGQTRAVSVDEETAYLLTASQPLRDIATVNLHTGMRPEEVFRIEVRNVDLLRKTVFNPWEKRNPPSTWCLSTKKRSAF